MSAARPLPILRMNGASPYTGHAAVRPRRGGDLVKIMAVMLLFRGAGPAQASPGDLDPSFGSGLSGGRGTR